MENINRGLVAVRDGNGYLVMWRLWGTESHSTAFNVYRNGEKVNSDPITESTTYRDGGAPVNSQYTVKPVVNGVEGEASEEGHIVDGAYRSIPLDMPQPQSGEPNYTPNDGSAADVDGDGEYEIVLKLEQNPKDNVHEDDTYNTVLDAYKLDGTFLWRIQLGYNIREGAHYTQFLAYDLDGDGGAEIAVKTAPGTRDGTGEFISTGPAANANHTARYADGNGRVLDGPEYLTVFDGMDGRELATVDYIPPRGNIGGWGGDGGNGGNDNSGNRVDRFLAAVAYLDGENPSAIMCRGYYGRSVLAAWDYRDGELTSRWVFDSENGDNPYSGQGAHSLSVADVDNDGKQEIVYGAMTVDDDGTGLYTTGLLHGDALHVSDFDPNRPGLEVYMIHENEGSSNGSPGSAFRAAEDGEIYWQTAIGQDVGRGLAADVDPDEPGAEFWQNNEGLFDTDGNTVGSRPGPTNFAIWWDGDLLRELLDGTSITKPSGGNMNLNASGCSSNNGSKSTPTLSADLWGDWREEVIFRCGNELRIFTTRFDTEYKFHTLMHDPQYRMAIAWQNVGYNQPPHPGFFIGAGMDYPAPPPDISLVGMTPVKKARPHFAASGYAPVSILNGRSVSLPFWMNEGDRLEVLNIAGEVVQEAVVGGGGISLSKPGVSNGVYFVRQSAEY